MFTISYFLFLQYKVRYLAYLQIPSHLFFFI
nr:MAG TPA: hypothetical protein [Caudoviricetes sp.]